MTLCTSIWRESKVHDGKKTKNNRKHAFLLTEHKHEREANDWKEKISYDRTATEEWKKKRTARAGKEVSHKDEKDNDYFFRHHTIRLFMLFDTCTVSPFNKIYSKYK